MVKGIYRDRLLQANRRALSSADKNSLLHQLTEKVAYYLASRVNEPWRNAQVRLAFWSADKEGGMFLPQGLDIIIRNYSSLDDLAHEVINSTEQYRGQHVKI